MRHLFLMSDLDWWTPTLGEDVSERTGGEMDMRTARLGTVAMRHEWQELYEEGRGTMDASTLLEGKYLKAAQLQGKARQLTVDRAEVEEVSDGEHKLVLYFSGKDKGLVLNKTNLSELVDQLGSETDGWGGEQVILRPDRTTFNGKMVACIRIGPKVVSKAKPAKAAPVVEADEIDDSDVPF